MPYSKNPHLPKVRRDAVNLVKYRRWSMRKTARHFGVEPSTVSRWCKHPHATGWNEIPTHSSRPHTSPNALKKEIVEAIIKKRIGRRRCGEVIYHELKNEGVVVSLPSVQRTLDRLGLLKKRSLWKRPHDKTERPEATCAGALIQLDTVHIHAPDGTRFYVYTMIDLYSRWAYAEVVVKISAKRSVGFVRRAQKASPFKFGMIQTDHGSEFSIWFTHALWQKDMHHRHSRVRKPNDNAHIERFNRSIQEECLDQTTHTIPDFRKALKKYLPYYNTERLHMGLNFKTPQEVLRRS
jgi:transposase InsO family protein